MKFNRVLALIMAVSAIATGVLLMNRMSAERSAKTVEIIADYTEMAELAKQSELSLSDWFKHFKASGVVSVALEEETFRSIKESGVAVNYNIGKLFKSDVNWQQNLPADAIAYLNNPSSDYDFVVVLDHAEAIEQIRQGLERGLEREMYSQYQENGKHTVFIVKGDLADVTYLSGNLVTDADEKILERPINAYSSKTELLGLGFDSKKIELIQASGLEVSPRPRNNTKAPWKLIPAFEADIKKYDIHPSHVIFSGGSVLGYELENIMPLDQLIQMFDRNGISVALIEAGDQLGNTEQDGIQYLAENSNYDVVRVFPVVKYIQKRFAFYNYSGPEEINNTIYRAVTERNIRSVYFRPFMSNEKEYIVDPQAYDDMFSNLKDRLADHGLTLGKASGFVFNGPNLLLQWLSTWGIVALTLWILTGLFDLKNKILYTLCGLGVLGAGGMLFVAPNLSVSIMALAAAIVYPSAAIMLFVTQMKKAYIEDGEKTLGFKLLEGGKLLLVGTLISMVGGLTVGGLLSHSSYLIEISYFRGVKLTLAAPFVIYTVIYLILFGFQRNKADLKTNRKFTWDVAKLLNLNIKIGYLIILGIAAAIGYVYIARSGHETNLQPSNLEMIFRNILEYKLLARPRTKEFLFAFPMVMATLVIARGGIKELLFPAGLIAVIGFSSIANTFSHLRTPVYLSVVRTAYSIGFGLLVGIAFALVAAVAVKLIHKYLRSPEHE